MFKYWSKRHKERSFFLGDERVCNVGGGCGGICKQADSLS